jgi:hypothetical protein
MLFDLYFLKFLYHSCGTNYPGNIRINMKNDEAI